VQIFELTTVLLGVVSISLAWLQYRTAKAKKISAAELVPHSSLRLYLNRDRVAKELIDMVTRARTGQVLFGSCKTCGNYPPEVHSAIARAAGRGVVIRFVVSDSQDSTDFVSFLQGLDPSRVSIRRRGRDYLRMLGIEGKEVMLAFPRTDSYTGLHSLDKSLVLALFSAFESLWNYEDPTSIAR
jgi:hypothetical protein